MPIFLQPDRVNCDYLIQQNLCFEIKNLSFATSGCKDIHVLDGYKNIHVLDGYKECTHVLDGYKECTCTRQI